MIKYWQLHEILFTYLNLKYLFPRVLCLLNWANYVYDLKLTWTCKCLEYQQSLNRFLLSSILSLDFISKQNPTVILIGSYLWYEEHRWRHHKQRFSFLSRKTNGLPVIMALYSNTCTLCATFLLLPYLTSSAIYYWTDPWLHKILLLLYDKLN